MRIAVFGAGYAGLTVTRRLERHLPDDVEIVVVDETGAHLVQHELHRVVRRPNLAETISVPLEETLTRAEHRQARVTDIDTEAGVATLEGGDSDDRETSELGYDIAAVCLGAETAFYDLPGVEEHAIPLKRLEHATAIRRAVRAEPNGTVVIGGGGLSGVQVAGELTALSEEDGLDLDITLVEMADQLAPGFDSVFADALRRELEARDVTVETDVAIEAANESTVGLADGRSLDHDIFVWTGGIRGPGVFDGERLPTGADLQVDNRTYVVGDAGIVSDSSGTTVPASAQTAVREAEVAAKNIVRQVNESRVTEPSSGEDTASKRYTYAFESPGWVVSIGDGAVAQVGPLVVSGDPARAIKAVIGADHLSSVGATEQASALVCEELGWPAGESVQFPEPIRAILDGRELDSNALSNIESSLVETIFAISEQFSPVETVDLTNVTRVADRDYPGSPANLFQRTVLNSFDSMLTLGRLSDSTDDEE